MSALALEGVTVPGRTAARLDAVSVSLRPCELTVLVGPNGSGKSTLLATLLGQARAARGRATVDGRDVLSLGVRARAAHLAWLPQDPVLEQGVTATEVVAAARFRHLEPWRVAEAHARETLAAHGLTTLQDARMETLSGGEAQRVRIAALQAQEAAWWLLDEPGNHLDAAVQLELLDLLRARVNAGGGVVLVTHALELLPHLHGLPVRVLGVRAGRLEVDAPLDAHDLPARLGALVGLELRAVTLAGHVRWAVLGRRP